MSVRFVRRRRKNHRHAARAPLAPLPDTSLMLAIITAGAAVACADGTVHRRERRALIDFLNARGWLRWCGPRAVLQAFNTRAAQLQTASPAQFHAALDWLRTLAGPERAHLVLAAARHVAMADGKVCPLEGALLQTVRDRMNLNPLAH